jgi:hypothetical protein
LERGDTARLTGGTPPWTAAEGRKFAFTLAGAFLVLSGIVWWRDHPTLLRIFAGLSGGLFVLGLIVPGRLGPLNRAWMGLALLISKVTTPIFMGVVYFLVLSPFGLVRRAFGHNAVEIARSEKSYWVRRTDGGSRNDMHRQF